jgi:SAM-dependent methyltransferase
MAEQALDDWRKQSYETWERLAPVWSREREFLWTMSRHVGEALVQKADVDSGDTVLELAAGTGETGFAAADAVGDSGQVISTDFSPEMVKVARERGEQLGLQNVEFRVMDAERMDLPDDSVDAVVCRWGYMLMADPAAALAQTRRVLRDDGRLAFAVWAAPDRNPWAMLVGMSLVERGHLPPPKPGAPGIFAMADPDRIRELVTGAGFDAPDIEEIGFSWDFGDFDRYWGFVTTTAGPIAAAIQAMDDGERNSLRGAIREKTAEYDRDGGFSMEGLCWLVTAS